MDTFLPNDYKIPETSNYMRFIEGENPFRVLSSAITGWEYFNNEKKPVRQKEEFDVPPLDIKPGGEIKPFWAFVVWNYNAKRVQILELTQKGIMKSIQAYVKNSKWGDPKEYDFIVTREGSGLDTEYGVAVNPKSPAPSITIPKINLEALYVGADPFLVE
jgi:hypothetical protein